MFFEFIFNPLITRTLKLMLVANKQTIYIINGLKCGTHVVDSSIDLAKLTWFSQIKHTTFNKNVQTYDNKKEECCSKLSIRRLCAA